MKHIGAGPRTPHRSQLIGHDHCSLHSHTSYTIQCRQDEEADDHGLKSKEVEEEEEYDEDGEDDDDGYGDCDDDTPSPAEVERQEKVAAGVALAAVGMQASVVSAAVVCCHVLQ